MLPPLIVSQADIEEAMGILDGALASVSVEEVKASR
jgi:acetylornithine/succinyldiaminopimelate/putrescine aminotransferase